MIVRVKEKEKIEFENFGFFFFVVGRLTLRNGEWLVCVRVGN